MIKVKDLEKIRFQRQSKIKVANKDTRWKNNQFKS